MLRVLDYNERLQSRFPRRPPLGRRPGQGGRAVLRNDRSIMGKMFDSCRAEGGYFSEFVAGPSILISFNTRAKAASKASLSFRFVKPGTKSSRSPTARPLPWPPTAAASAMAASRAVL